MKNLIAKTLGIAGITALSFLPLKNVQGQDILEVRTLDSEIKTASLNKNYLVLLGNKSTFKSGYSRWYMNIKEANDPKQITLIDSIYTVKVPRTSKDNENLIILKKETKVSILDTLYLHDPHVTLLYGTVKVVENPK